MLNHLIRVDCNCITVCYQLYGVFPGTDFRSESVEVLNSKLDQLGVLSRRLTVLTAHSNKLVAFQLPHS